MYIANNNIRRLKKLKRIIFDSFLRTKACIQKNGIKTFWYWDDIVTNFGDLITPYLLKKYGYTALRSKKEDATLISTGSILQGMPDSFKGKILGTGLIREQPKTFEEAKIIALRGELTKRCLGINENIPLGDPGLLLSKFIKEKKKCIEVGIVPHYTDLNTYKLGEFKKYFGKACKIIDVRGCPEKVASEISKCYFIISSSLHGLIVAHTFSIESVWLILGDGIVGGRFKYYDYASSLDLDFIPLILQGKRSFRKIEKFATLPSKSALIQRRSELDIAFTNNLH